MPKKRRLTDKAGRYDPKYRYFDIELTVLKSKGVALLVNNRISLIEVWQCYQGNITSLTGHWL